MKSLEMSEEESKVLVEFLDEKINSINKTTELSWVMKIEELEALQQKAAMLLRFKRKLQG